MNSLGRKPSSKAVAYFLTAPSSSEMEKLQLEGHETILRMERIRYADDVPICFEVASIPEKFIHDFSKERSSLPSIKCWKKRTAENRRRFANDLSYGRFRANC